ncbi:MAG: alanine racemase [Porticoccus sp.]
MSRPAKALIDLDALRYNCQLANSLSPNSQTMAVIKANAYGHGAVPVAQALTELVPAFGVACIEEAIELREAGIENPIHLLEGAFSNDEISIAAEKNFSLAVVNQEQKRAILDADPSTPLRIWICVDTGMHRLGITPDELVSTYREMATSNNVAGDIVVATHFACADDLENDFTAIQLARMTQAADDLHAPKSFANSAGLIGWTETRADWNRPGIMLYGSSPFSTPHPDADRLLPVMTFKSAVIALRDIQPGETVGYAATWKAERPTRIATVAIGYGDGYPLHAPSGTPVLINGQRCPMVGRVSMDMITVDVTDLPGVVIEDEVILWGAGLSVNEIAACAGTISYELLTRMPRRTPRVYIND